WFDQLNEVGKSITLLCLSNQKESFISRPSTRNKIYFPVRMIHNAESLLSKISHSASKLLLWVLDDIHGNGCPEVYPLFLRRSIRNDHVSRNSGINHAHFESKSRRTEEVPL